MRPRGTVKRRCTRGRACRALCLRDRAHLEETMIERWKNHAQGRDSAVAGSHRALVPAPGDSPSPGPFTATPAASQLPAVTPLRSRAGAQPAYCTSVAEVAVPSSPVHIPARTRGCIASRVRVRPAPPLSALKPHCTRRRCQDPDIHHAPAASRPALGCASEVRRALQAASQALTVHHARGHASRSWR